MQKNENTLYDWDKRWRSLSIIGRKTGGISLVVGGQTTFKEMFEKGFLTGEALKDAENVYSGKIKFGETRDEHGTLDNKEEQEKGRI